MVSSLSVGGWVGVILLILQMGKLRLNTAHPPGGALTSAFTTWEDMSCLVLGLFPLGQEYPERECLAPRDSLAVWLQNPGLMGPWAVWFPRVSGESFPWPWATSSGPAHPCTCVGLPGGTPLPSSHAGQPPGAFAGQTNWKSLPTLCRVNPGVPDTCQPPCRGGEFRWRTEPSEGHCREQIPLILRTAMLPVLSTKQGTATRARRDLTKTEGEVTEHHPHHDGPQSLPHFCTSTGQGSAWLTLPALPPSLGEASVLGPEASSCPAVLPGWGFRLGSSGKTQRTRA